MLTFYPEFEVDEISDNEIIFLLDLSNSMKVPYILVQQVWEAEEPDMRYTHILLEASIKAVPAILLVYTSILHTYRK